MLRYIGRRLLNYAVLLYVAISLTFVLAATQLNPRALFQLRQPPIEPAIIEQQLLKYNLSDSVPLIERYWIWLTGIFHGDWGKSPLGVDVAEQIQTRMWVSLRLLVVGTLAGIIIGVAVGAWTATRQYKLSDRAITALSLLIISTPAFVIGHLAQIGATSYNNASRTRTFEFIGETGDVGDYPFADLVDRAQHLLLPTLVLIVLGAASMSRIQRNLMLDSLGADYVRTARAKGLRENKAVMKHALRTALIPTGTYFAFSVATMFVGATFTERIFSFPGIGQYGVDTITNRDVYGVIAVTAFAGVCVLAGAVLSDIMVAVLDPRVRLQ
jgi:peptide/nickel transport system permease protein